MMIWPCGNSQIYKSGANKDQEKDNNIHAQAPGRVPNIVVFFFFFLGNLGVYMFDIGVRGGGAL